jgi:N-acetylglucosamine-6-sulfatase
VAWLERKGLLDSTIVVYMGDNGHHFGERGLVDKRDAYETSMRVPLLALGPGRFPAGRAVDEVVANIDVAPTLLEAAGLPVPRALHGQSFLRLLRGEGGPFRPHVVYEYFWERNYPYTPTMHALRGRKWKYIRTYGLWDLEELYDLESDPEELRNLALAPAHRDVLERQKAALWEALAASGGFSIPWSRDAGPVFPLRRREGARAADFPKHLFEPPPAP